ncbi:MULTISPECIES: BLUF domain-containing protein [unclassified Sphingomonas]|uniref:BLUF domain-containing protein n=1 Tax=unclassified Sphingomonas TaxID=196159 RepID=UPI002151E0B3|nr:MULTISPECIES: BLUF domain-containing protein [unclassified Sphingomonas]MCR5872397.1 BLUF domain-containing protein [Sphingomonas sp. J344]UUX99313.1 BLUF domain-containing protein [Sphingomonas sp. J315]
MYQLMYISSVRAGTQVEVAPILLASRRNNDRHGITGFLYADGRRFLQVLEGPQDAVEQTFARIAADPRHCAIVILSRRAIEMREFGDWAMAHRVPGAESDALMAQIADRLSTASPNVRATFEGFAKIRRAA